MNKKKDAYKLLLAVGMAAVMTVGSGVAANADTGQTLAYAGGWQTNGIFNPQPQANGNVLQDGVAYAPLAYYKFTGNYDFWPVLAKSWTVSNNGNQVTIHLNPNAKWSNGASVTAQDVYVTFEMQFIVQNAQSWGVTGMKVLNPQTIVFYKNPKFLYNTSVLLQQLLNNNNILPAADFQQLLPSEKELWKAVKDAGGTPGAKTTQAGQALLTKWSKAIEGYNFKSGANLLFDGAWTFSRGTSAQQLYTKNPNFVFAKNITASQVLVTNQTSNDVTWRALENGQIDYAGVSFSPPVFKTVMGVHSNHFVAAPQSTGMAFYFNEKIYPYNMVKVRQALAYLINRPDATKIGEPIGSSDVALPDGMTTSANQQWLSAAQIKSLNPYHLNPQKAFALLKSVGFKKTSQGWMMSNGKPFKVNLYAPNYSDWDAGVQAIASQLNAIGIKAQADVMDGTIYYSSNGASSGKYGIFSDWWGGWNVYPSNTYNQAYFSEPGSYSVSNTGQIEHNKAATDLMNVPETLTSPSVGSVDVLKTTVAIQGNLSAAVQKSDIYKLAATYDYWLPALDVWNQLAGRTYSTERWNWPNFAKNPALLNMFTYNTPVVVYQVLGLMTPKK